MKFVETPTFTRLVTAQSAKDTLSDRETALLRAHVKALAKEL